MVRVGGEHGREGHVAERCHSSYSSFSCFIRSLDVGLDTGPSGVDASVLEGAVRELPLVAEVLPAEAAVLLQGMVDPVVLGISGGTGCDGSRS
jgi:hypothetical protein